MSFHVSELNKQLNNEAKERFIIKFIGAFDIPLDYGSKCDPFLCAYIQEHVVQYDVDNRKFFKLQRISPIVQTPKRTDCTNVIWNCYRDFKMTPPTDSILTIEIYHGGDLTDSKLLGKVDIPVKTFSDEAPKIFNFVSTKASTKSKNPNFSITLSRCFIFSPPPLQKTFFLIRHGESKWNLAQSKLNVTGMLDRDHALTEEGIRQAEELNERWKSCLYGSCHHADDGNKHSKIEPDHASKVKFEMKRKDSKNLSRDLEEAEKPNNATGNLLDLDDYLVDSPSCKSTKAVDGSTLIHDPDWNPFDNEANNILLADGTTGSSSQDGTTTGGGVGAARGGTSSSGGLLIDTSPDISRDHNDFNESSHSLLLDPLSGLDDATINYGPSSTGVNLSSTRDFNEHPVRVTTPTKGLDSWDDEFDPSRSTAAIISDFHSNCIVDIKNSPKPATLALHAEASEVTHEKIDEQEFITQRREDYIKLFRHADRIYSSPLTRAIETAYVSMEGHPAMSEGITLYSIIREVKRIGGLDTVGIAYGDEIKPRLRAELSAVLGPSRTEELLRGASSFNINDANEPWWTGISGYENGEKQQERVREFISFVKHCGSKLPIFVGHSLFFRAFYSKRLSTLLLNNRPEISENLKKFRLSNASLLAVTVSFTDIDGACEAIITDADLIFGGGFHGVPTAEEEDDDEEGGGKGGSEKNAAASPQQFFSSMAELKEKFKMNNMAHELQNGKDALKKGVQLFTSKLGDFFDK